MANGFQRRSYFQPDNIDTGRGAVLAAQSGLLQSFANRAQQTAEGIATIEGQSAGAEAGASGTPKLLSNLTAYGRAYNEAAVRNYVISKFSEMETEIARIEADSGSDPDRFVQVAQGLRNGAISKALPQARGLLATLYSRRIAEGSTRIIDKQIAEQKALNGAMLEQGAAALTDSISRKLVSGDPLLIAQAAQEEDVLAQMIDGAVASNDLTPDEAIKMKADRAKQVTEQLIYGEFERQMREGDPVSFIARVMTQPVENLSDDQKQVVISNLYTRLNHHQALVTENQQLEEAEQKARWKQGEQKATLAMLQRTLSLAQLSRMVANDELNPAVARTLENDLTSAKQGVDDPVLELAVRTNLLAYEEEEIARLGGLSHTTRAELVLKRREEAETWRNDQGAQEALRRIDLALGIPEGLNAMQKIAITPEKATAAARARSYFYDLVEATKPEERRAKYFELAGQAVRETGKDVKRIELDKARRALEAVEREFQLIPDPDDEQQRTYEEAKRRRIDAVKRLEQELAK